MKKVFAFFFCLCLLVITAMPIFAKEKVTIELWHAMRGEKKEVVDKLTANFMKENPDIIVNTKAISTPDLRLYGNNYSCLYRQLIQGLAEGKQPDISQVYENWTTQFVEINAITPFSHFDNTPYAMTEADKKDFIPLFKNACSYNGVMWTIPFNKSVFVLYYNKDILDKYGVKVPKTWKELKEASIKIAQSDSSKYGIIYTPVVDAIGHLIYSNNGSFIKDNKPTFNDNIGVEALKYWTELANAVDGKAGKPTFNSYKEFLDGNAAFTIETSARIEDVKNKCKFHSGVATLPSGTSKAVQCAGTNLAIFSKDETKKLASWKLIKYLTNTENNAELAMKTGYLPVRYSTYNSPIYKKYVEKFPGYKVGMEELKYGVTQPRTSAWESMRGLISDALFDAVSNVEEPEEALNRAADISKDLLTGVK